MKINKRILSRLLFFLAGTTIGIKQNVLSLLIIIAIVFTALKIEYAE